jgi:hypothetical protein
MGHLLLGAILLIAITAGVGIGVSALIVGVASYAN